MDDEQSEEPVFSALHTYSPPGASTSGLSHAYDAEAPPRDEKAATQSYAYASAGSVGAESAAMDAAA